MDVALLDYGFPEATRRVYKKGRRGSSCLLPFRASENPKLLKPLARSPALLVPLHRSSGPRQANRAPPLMVRSDVVFFLICCKCVAGRFAVRRYLERFGDGGVTARPHSGVRRFEDFLGSRAGYAAVGVFWERCWARPGAEEIPEPEGELVVSEVFFTAGLRLPAHRFVVEVLQRFEVQVHQLTPNVMVALAKYVWAVTSYGGQPSVEVFAKNYCLFWQKRKIGSKIAQFGSCTFTPRTGKTSVEVVELVPCARNKWGNWWDYWFYVSGDEVKELPGLPAAVMCSHCYVAFPPFEVAEDDEDEGALRCATRMSSARDLVEEFIGYGVWPLAHGWVLGEVCPRQMPTLGQQLV
jgi:hypothetical protein